MNIFKNKLISILGNKVPRTALTFCTHKNCAWFTTKSGRMIERKLSKQQIENLRKENLLGSLGWSMY
jgi:hypothetical protein